MDINKAKGIVLATLFFVTFFSCMLPLKLANVIRHTVDPARRLRYGRIMSFLNCFAGGVFLGTCLLDLFPEVQDNIQQVIKVLNINTSFPAAEFLVAVGLFIVLIVEQISLDCKSDSTRMVLVSEETSLVAEREIPARATRVEYGSIPINSASDGHDHFGDHGAIANNSALRSLLLLVALSLHSVFEGLAIGLQENVEEVLSIFAAVILHKCVIAFAPLGLGIGMGVEAVSDSLHTLVISGVLQGLACGTFLYVTFFEILPHELNSSDLRMPKLLLILLGFGAAVAIVFLDPDTAKPKSESECPDGFEPSRAPISVPLIPPRLL